MNELALTDMKITHYDRKDITMETTGIVRRVDQLGRVVLPMDLRRTLGIAARDAVAISTEGKRIVLERFERGFRPVCEICGGTDGLVGYRGKKVCRGCIELMKLMKV